jgi:hypothetical protein
MTGIFGTLPGMVMSALLIAVICECAFAYIRNMPK